jgi:hypothetical protein
MYRTRERNRDKLLSGTDLRREVMFVHLPDEGLSEKGLWRRKALPDNGLGKGVISGRRAPGKMPPRKINLPPAGHDRQG